MKFTEPARVRRNESLRQLWSKTRFAAGAVAATALLLSSAPAQATDTICSGQLSGGPYDNVVVPFNTSCDIDDARITGNITVLAGGQLAIIGFAGDTTIDGNVAAKGSGCGGIVREGSAYKVVVGGNVTIQNCGVDTKDRAGCERSSLADPPPLLIGGTTYRHCAGL